MRWNKDGPTDKVMQERLMFGSIDPGKKPELSHDSNKDALGTFSFDQHRQALKRNSAKMSEEGGGKFLFQSSQKNLTACCAFRTWNRRWCNR